MSNFNLLEEVTKGAASGRIARPVIGGALDHAVRKQQRDGESHQQAFVRALNEREPVICGLFNLNQQMIHTGEPDHMLEKAAPKIHFAEGTDGKAMEKVNALASEYRRANPKLKLSPEQAVNHILRQHPDLYREEKRERGLPA